MLYLRLHEIERAAAELRCHLCPECKLLYQPCVAVKLSWDEECDRWWDRRLIVHIVPKAYVLDDGGRVRDPEYGVRFCDWESGKLAKLEGCSVFFARHPLLQEARGEFEKWLLQCHPELVGQPWTKPVLDWLGIDLEAEIAMWQLSQ
jgi:hypothetical protein